MKRKFIINPAARGNRRWGSIYKIAAHFRRELGELDAILPGHRRDTIASTRRALHAGYDQIVAVGGDGTVNAVVNGFFEKGEMIRPEAALVVGRAGSGSDYFRALYKPSARTDWRTSVTHFSKRRVDVGRIDFGDGKEPTFFVNLASLGMSVGVVKKQRTFPRWVPGRASYLLPALGAVASLKCAPLKIELDDQTFEGDVLSVFIAKGVTAGGGMRVGGAVALDDGKFDVTILKGMSRLEAMSRFHRMFSGRFDDEKYFLKVKSSRVKISSVSKQELECDGEVVGSTDLTITCLPKALTVCVGS